MNNKGFAITTILFGITILFCLLLVSLLGILATYKNNMEKLVNNGQGAAREIATMTPNTDYASLADLKASANPKRGLYCFGNNCRYISNECLKSNSCE